jgi:hypothetical protein
MIPLAIIKNTNLLGALICGFLCLINFLLMYATILSEPGVPASVYLRYSKHNQGHEVIIRIKNSEA